MSLHKEIEFENDICAHLATHGWLYQPALAGAEGDFADYDRARAMFPADIVAWVQTTQPKAWDALSKSHGACLPSGGSNGDRQAATEAVLLDRIRKQLDDRGTLDVLRHGIELLGLRQPLQLAQFKPALAMNPELQAKYAANRLRVVRQVRYSLFNENAIDLVLFLNGLPIATVELKSDFTQSVEDAVDQYRFDRLPAGRHGHPKPKGQAVTEPLLDFPRGALVHFAVSNSAVMMTTRLLGAATTFLPFNLGDHGAAGNPVNPHGHRTAYSGGANAVTLAFLSQIFDYGNTAIEKRAIFFKRLLPLLEFGREREGVDLSKVTLTHHKLKDQGKRNLALVNGEYPKLAPLTEPGSGEVREQEKIYLMEIIAKVNDLFEGELTDDDKLIYVNHVLKGKLLESDILVQQASNNTKEQFANSPDLANELMNAIMDALTAHSSLSKQALGSEKVRSGLKDVLLGPAQLYESLRKQRPVARSTLV
ncbi:MAG: type I restriction endonuclease subunit R [Gallionella sp.]|nr:type I restriction endonuclease subunit R [Gallionella sp.]